MAFDDLGISSSDIQEYAEAGVRGALLYFHRSRSM